VNHIQLSACYSSIISSGMINKNFLPVVALIYQNQNGHTLHGYYLQCLHSMCLSYINWYSISFKQHCHFHKLRNHDLVTYSFSRDICTKFDRWKLFWQLQQTGLNALYRNRFWSYGLWHRWLPAHKKNLAFASHFYPDDKGSMFLQNIEYLKDHMI